jgi:hypothetical protein
VAKFMDVHNGLPGARRLIAQLLAGLRPALESTGDWKL